MRRIKRALIWLSRIGYCRGFGVQSPNDYRFIRYVINEHAPYYQYDHLSRQLPDIDADLCRLYKLYFRIANYLQPVYYIDMMPADTYSAVYVCAGCHKTKHIPVDVSNGLDQHIKMIKEPALVRISNTVPVSDIERIYKRLFSEAATSVIVVMEGIYENKERHHLWCQMVKQKTVCISYDLYYCGLLLFESRRYKKHYKVNF